MIHPETRVLTTDALEQRERRRDYAATDDALAVVAMLSDSIEKGSPGFDRSLALLSLEVPWGTVQVAADGKSLICVERADPARFEFSTISWEPEAIPEPARPAP
jgi:hypothetical protein